MLGRALLSTLAISLLSCATGVFQTRWHLVETPNFELACTADSDYCFDIAVKLERFRFLVGRMTNAGSQESPIPTKMLVFESVSDLRRMGAPRWSVGYFVGGASANHLVIADRWKLEDTIHTVLHEYTHYLIRNGSAIQYPQWYDEGFATFMSTTKVKDGDLIVGQYPMGSMRTLGSNLWIPMAQVLSARGIESWPARDIGSFYAQSWALVHYLNFGRGEDYSLSDEMSRYLDLVEAGETDATAFSDAFGMDPRVLDRVLPAYLSKGRLGAVSIPVAALGFETPKVGVRALGPAEVNIRLGEHALAVGDGERAEALFSDALATDPALPRGQAGLAAACVLLERYDDAQRHFQQALDLDSGDPHIQLAYGKYWYSRAAREEGANERRDLLRLARKRFARSHQIDPTIPEAYARYGQSFLVKGEDVAQAIEPLEHAHDLLRANLEFAALLAQAYLQNDREADARPLLARSIAWSHDEEFVDALEEQLATSGETSGGGEDPAEETQPE